MSALPLAVVLHLAASCAPTVAPETLLSVAGTESGYTRAGRAFTHPYAINVNGPGGGTRFYETAAAAAAAAGVLVAAGVTNIDLGIAQVNWRAGHLQRRGLPLSAAFDPCTDLRVGGEVLVECWGRASGAGQARLHAAIGCYNTGSVERGAAYVQRVQATAAQIVPAIRIAGSPAQADDSEDRSAAPPPPTSTPPPRDPSEPPAWDAWAHDEWERSKLSAPAASDGAVEPSPPVTGADPGAPDTAASPGKGQVTIREVAPTEQGKSE